MFDQLDQREFVHRIDAEDRICFVNAAWLEFARENGWDTTADAVLGRPLLEAMSDPETRYIYRLLLDRVRETGRPVAFDYRCDSPDERRLLRLRMRHDRRRDQVELSSRVLRIERRDPVALLDSHRHDRSDAVLSVCSWCKAVLTGQAWVEAEQAVLQLRLFSAESLPRISHGICPTCTARMLALAAPT